MKFIPYHKIRQYKDIVRDIKHNSDYKGNDAEGNAIYETSEKPILTFRGTVKLHGTNAGICYHPKEGIMAQKRSSFLKPDDLTAHFEFNRFVQVSEKHDIQLLMSSLHDLYCSDNEQITLYGEWAGNGIQKGVAISEHIKSFYMFDCAVYNMETEEVRWVSLLNVGGGHGVLNILDFQEFEVNIDFNNPELTQNKLIEITEGVEKSCPVSRSLGHEGIGEGVVWSCHWKGQKYIFKVKGEKHSVSKVKKLASIDPEVVRSISDFIDYACTKNRIEQGIQEVGATEKKDMPNLLRWVANDIITEENDVLVANGLEWKQVQSEFSNRVRMYYFEKLNKV